MPDVHPDQASPEKAEAAFSFLSHYGLQLTERLVTGGNTVRDGWRLVYKGSALTVTVEYLDSQFELHFARAGVVVDYLFIDRELFARRSGLHGNMFVPEKLAPVIALVASDVREHFGSILEGDDKTWAHIKHLVDAPKSKARLP